jgi:hypothetical protein
MAIMKQLFNLVEIQELMAYFGDDVGNDAVIELTSRTQTNPETLHLIVSKGADLKVISPDEYLPTLADGWFIEMDSELLLREGICYRPTPEQLEE